MSSRVLVPLADGFEEIEALAIVDVLRRGDVQVITAAIGDTDEVRGAHGVIVIADELLSDVIDDDFDAIILPGGGEGTENLGNCDELLLRLRRQREEGKLLCAICAAPTVLAKAGVLEQNTMVTCYPSMHGRFGRTWVSEPVVDHNGIITSQAPGTAMLFALVVLRSLVGNWAANKVAHDMVTDVAF